MTMLASFYKNHDRALFGLMAALVCAACAKPPPPPPPPAAAPPPKPTALDMTIQAASMANPDARGRPSPVVLRIVELKGLAAFEAADFFSLFERDKETLGGELVAREEMMLQPGEQRASRRELNAETRFVGVIAAYRDIDRSVWRASMPVTPHQTMPVRVDVLERQVSLGKQ